MLFTTFHIPLRSIYLTFTFVYKRLDSFLLGLLTHLYTVLIAVFIKRHVVDRAETVSSMHNSLKKEVAGHPTEQKHVYYDL